MQEKNISNNNFEQCQKCAICNQVCPVMSNNPRYAGPKQSGPDGERYRMKNGIFFDDALKYCMNCKRCEVACPSGVRIADMIQQAKIESGRIKPKFRDLMLASTDIMGPLATSFAPIVNWGLGLQWAKKLLGATIKIAPERTMPKYADQTFERWFKRNKAEEQKTFSKQLSYFHGCYANYNYPQLGKDFVKVLNAFGYTGGFSITALKGGAKRVVTVDASKKAISAAEENLALNGYSKEENPCLVADMKEYVTQMGDGEFDLIILDPPAFAKRHQDRHRGLGGYRYINAEAIKRIAKGGLLFTFSCSQAVDKATFQGIVTAAAIEAKRNVKILYQLSQPTDHPINIFHPEGAYLKGLVLMVD